MAERRCLVTGEVGPPEGMIRFVVGPDLSLVPDLAGRLPGRGMWVGASRALVDEAVRRRAFDRAAKLQLKIAPGLADRIEALLRRRCLDFLGLGRRAGEALAGFEKVREAMLSGRVGVLLVAADAGRDGRSKLARLAGDLPQIATFSSAELSLALGRENVIHAALAPGRLAGRFLVEIERLAGFLAPSL
ncbi:MAG TPA: RNA-binding protein [Candidatus Cybelea sp.]|nr:RNA-binding protein [Candidatus Cybelea sp.]